MIARFALMVLGALALGACERAAEQSEWPSPSPAIWEAEAPTGEKGWLLGTVHALPDGVRWHTRTLDEVIAAAHLLIVEINDPGSSGGQSLFRDMAETPGQPDLTARVAARDRPALRDLMDRADADNEDFDRTETWAAALILAAQIRAGEPGNGVDRALIAHGIPVLALETRAAQLAIFDALAESEQASLLAATAREAQAGDPTEALRAWLTGDLERLEAIGEAGTLGVVGLRDALLTRRNLAWIERIERAIAEGRQPLVAVGAAHMLGDDGLPALLAARGYEVRRLQ